MSLVVRAAEVVLPDGIRPAAVHAEGGRITAVTGYDDVPDDAVTLADDEVLLPGLVDSHVHVNEPGRTEWEGFASATRAAAAGGVTTIVDMPLNSIPPTVDSAALAAKQAVARPQALVDVGFWGGAVPGNLAELEPLPRAGGFGFKCFLLDSGVPGVPPLAARQAVAGRRAWGDVGFGGGPVPGTLAELEPLHRAGVFGFKCFLLDSGVPEFPPLDAAGFDAAMAELGRIGALMVVHAED